MLFENHQQRQINVFQVQRIIFKLKSKKKTETYFKGYQILPVARGALGKEADGGPVERGDRTFSFDPSFPLTLVLTLPDSPVTELHAREDSHSNLADGFATGVEIRPRDADGSEELGDVCGDNN